MATKVPSELIADLAITGSKLHTALGNTGVTANSTGLHIGQEVGTSATVQFQTVTGSHAGTIAAATTGTTQANTDNSAKMATTAFVTNKIQELIGGAPSTLNDLNELAAAINDDASYNSTLTTALALKAPIASPTFTGGARVNGDFTVGAATGEDKFVVAPQAAGSGTFVISYNDAGNAYEPLTVDFETLALRTSGTPRISIASNGDIDLGDTTVKADGQLLVNLTSSDVGASVNAIEADGNFRFRNGNWGIKNNDGSYETWLARSLTGNKTIYGEKLTVDIGNSRVGINTTSPGRTLDVKGSVQFSVNSSSHETFVFSTQGVDEAKQIMKNAANVSTIVLNTNGVSYVNGGNFGIGVASPSTKLHVGGIVQVAENNNTAFYGGNYVRVFGDQNYAFRNTGGSYIANISMSGNSYFNGGNVGIGTASPNEKLEVAGSIRLANMKLQNVSSGRIGFNRNTATGAIYDSGVSAFQINGPFTGSDYLDFQSYSSAGAYVDSMVMKAGNVGIGTTSPGAKLEISGKDDSGASDLLRLQFDNSPGDTGITFTDINSTIKNRITMDSTNTADLRISSGTKIHLYGGTTNGTTSPHLTVSNDGSVGIATATPDYTLEVVGDSMIGDASAVTSPAFGAQQQIVKSFTYGADGAGRNGNLYLLNTNTGGDAGLITFGGYSNHTNNLYYQTGGIGGGTEAQDGGSWGGYLSFITTSDGSKGQASGMYEHMRITGDGHIQIKQTGSAPTNGVMLPGHIEFKGQGWDSNSGSDDMNAKIEMAATYGKLGSGATSPELVFSLQGAGGLDASSESYVEGMRLVGAGQYNYNEPRLGIGTTAPSKGLEVYSNTNTGGAQITGGSSAANISLHINNTATDGVNWNISSTGGGHGYGSGQLHFGVAYGVPKMKIMNSGFVGIGHATGAHNPQKVLEVEVPSNDVATIGARTLGINNFAGIHFGYKENNTSYRKSAIVFERTDRYSSNAQGKVHILNGPMSGSGSATLADAKLTINEDGNVGIGKQAPERKLHIVGDTTSQGQYPLGLDAVNTDYTMEFRRNGVSEWWIAQSSSAFRIHENGVADMFRINATDGNIVLGRTRSTDTETSYTQQTFQFYLDCHVNGADEAAEEKDAVFSRIWRKSAVLHPGQYSNGNYYVGIGVNSADTVSYVVFKLNVDKATELFASTMVANSADGTTRANKIYYSRDDQNWTLLQSENWTSGGNTCASTLTLSSLPGFSGGFYTGTIFLKFAIEGTGSGHTNLIGWHDFNIRARAQHASLTGAGFQRSKNDLTLSGNANTGHGYTPMLHSYGHQYSGTNHSAIVAGNAGTQTFASKGFGHEEYSIFKPVTNASIGANGLQIMKTGLLHCTFNQDIITVGSSSYCSCTVRRYNEGLTASVTVCSTLRTNTDGQWDMINGDFICDVVAGDIITFTYAATSIASMDGGTWSNYNFMLHPTAITSQGTAGSSSLPWVHQ
jgi:hypothetical protein